MSRISYYTLFALMVAILGIQTAHADVFSSTDGLYLTYDPVNPAPHDQVTVTAHNASSDLSQDTITWLVKGKQVAQDVGLTTYTINDVGGLGVITPVSISVSGPDANGKSQTTINPSMVDILVDSSSYIPPFYKGRAIPGPGTSIHLYAIPYILDTHGNPLPANTLRYSWTVNSVIQGSRSGIGKRSLSIDPPLFNSTYRISVVVSSSDGHYSASGNTVVSVPTPSIQLYVDNARLGILFNQALSPVSNINDTETTFQAIPYGVAANSPSDSSLTYQWSVNGSPVLTKNTTLSDLILNANKSSGTANISVHLTSEVDFLLNVVQNWVVQLQNGVTSQTSSSGLEPKDPFHSTK